MKKKKVVITGATGAIGIALIKKYLENNAQIIVISHQNSKRIDRIPVHPNVSIIQCELEELPKVAEQIHTSCDVFYHLAWMGTTGESRNDVFLQELNVLYTLKAVELAHLLGCRTFIGTGSQAEYGRIEGKLNDKVPCNPENGYGIAKLSAGQLTRIQCKQYGMKHIWLRVLSVYGPYDGENSMVMSTIRKILQHEETLFTPGEQLWDYVYSEDAAMAIETVEKYGKDGKVYCIGSGLARPLKEYIRAIFKELQMDINDEEIGLGKIPYSEKQVMCLQADMTEIENMGFTLKYTFEQGIKETVEWYRSTGR